MTTLPKTSEKALAKDTHIVSIAVEIDDKLPQLIKFDSRTSLSGKDPSNLICK